MNYEGTKEEKFESIYCSYERDVYRACLHITMDEDLALDMTQQAFVNFYERFETLKVECVKAYLIQSAKNLTYNYFRKLNRGLLPSEEDEELSVFEPAIESTEELYFEDVRKMMIKTLTDEIMEDLKENHENWYVVLHRMFFLDMTHEEIAAELGLTKDVIYSRLHRAKLWIQKNYKNHIKKLTDTA